ncbi:MAG TPA: polymer-forming cytoskeletal protein [Thauera sp.]|uniref:bactofilin family protein n=1 Tax=Thauera sp. TaxID=1905334 RepID=UPI002BFFAFA1|nr:polymer-forming cytoskeletal protein [Thauera sp.]HRP23683.1 polymer-forming cytoskeletal protein [Thauera sp.]HRP64869.1 polymer-forming cytoskeletal protein [Thauera sp.]
MFNKPNLFHKTAETPVTRTQRPLGSTSAVSSASAEPAASTGGSTLSTPAESANPVRSPDVIDTPVEPTGVDVGESRLIVGPDVKLKGAEILDCDTLVVEGRVEATMDSRVLRIAEKGAYKGTVGIDIAEIHGHFEGELTARKQLLIHSTGRVSGKIRYGKILIEEGGEISGDVQSLSALGKEGLRAVDKPADARPLAAVAG